MPDANNPQDHTGLFDSGKRLFATFLNVLRTRLDLLSTELEEERQHFIYVLVGTIISVFCGMVGVLLLVLFLVMLTPEAYRFFTLGGFALLFLLGSWQAYHAVQRRIQDKPRLFAGSMEELRQDVEEL